MTYEEANWAKLSPKFRDAHNRLRQARGQETLPPPKIDLYVPPPPRQVRAFDPSNAEFIGAVREFHGGAVPFAGAQGEGFTINGSAVSFNLNDEERARDAVRRSARVTQARVDEGFRINGRVVR